MTQPLGITGGAGFSADGKQRLWLTRQWPHSDWVNLSTQTTGWVCHNPSTADGEKDDPTLRRIIEFTNFWRMNRIVVFNLIPFISATPAEAHAWVDACHLTDTMEYRRTMQEALSQCMVVIAAWGAIAREQDVAHFIEVFGQAQPGRSLLCIGQTKDGHPIHPLARGKNRPPLADPTTYWRPL